MILEKLHINFIMLCFLKKQYFHVLSTSKTLPRCFCEIYAIPSHIKLCLEKLAPSGFECSPESKPKEVWSLNFSLNLEFQGQEVFSFKVMIQTSFHWTASSHS